MQKTKRVHKLVAIAFLSHKPSGRTMVVDHKNNDKTNNNVSNLQIITQRENLSKDKKGGSSQYTGVSWSKPAEKWVAHININYKLKYLGVFESELDASTAYQTELKLLLKNKQ